MELFDYKDIALVSREKSGIALYPNKTIVITTDFIKNGKREQSTEITLDDESSNVKLLAKSILFESSESNLIPGEDYSTIYGERLIEILRWIIQVLKTHSHGPNSPAVPDFHKDADEWLRKMTSYILNENVKTR